MPSPRPIKSTSATKVMAIIAFGKFYWMLLMTMIIICISK